jgi:hypothetical protein
MRLCTVCRVHPVLSIGMNDELCNNCMHKMQKHFVGSVVHYPDGEWNRDQGQYFQSFGPHPFGTPIRYTIKDYPGQDPQTVVGATVATNDSVKVDLNQTDQQSQQIDAAFNNCHSSDPNTASTIAQWKAFYAGYLKFSQSTHAFLGNTTAQLLSMPTYLYDLQQADNSLQSYVQQMNQWANTANSQCGGSVSTNKSGSPTGLGGFADILASITKNITTLAIIGAVIIGGIYGYSLYDEYKHT